MKLRKAALFLLLVAVLAPIVVYTDTLGTYLTDSSSTSGHDFIVEEASSFTFGCDIRPLNVLPQESATLLNLLNSESSSESLTKFSDVSTTDNARTTRQLTEESMEGQTTILSTSSQVGTDGRTDKNPIRLVTDAVPEAQNSGEQLNKHESSGKSEIKTAQTDASKEISWGSVDKPDNSSGKVMNSNQKKRSFQIEAFKHKVVVDPKYADKTWKILEHAIHEIYNHNASGLSIEELLHFTLFLPKICSLLNLI